MDKEAKPDPAEVLVQWQARDAKLRQTSCCYGVATREQVAGKSGLELFNATLRGELPGCAVGSALPAGKAYTTAELKINIVRPLTSKVPLVRADAHGVHVGGRMATAEARLTGADGKLYANGSTTCFIFDK